MEENEDEDEPEVCPECGQELDAETGLCLECNLGKGEPLIETGGDEANGI
jgi:hypothetical protein